MQFPQPDARIASSTLPIQAKRPTFPLLPRATGNLKLSDIWKVSSAFDTKLLRTQSAWLLSDVFAVRTSGLSLRGTTLVFNCLAGLRSRSAQAESCVADQPGFSVMMVMEFEMRKVNDSFINVNAEQLLPELRQIRSLTGCLPER